MYFRLVFLISKNRHIPNFCILHLKRFLEHLGHIGNIRLSKTQFEYLNISYHIAASG